MGLGCVQGVQKCSWVFRVSDRVFGVFRVFRTAENLGCLGGLGCLGLMVWVFKGVFRNRCTMQCGVLGRCRVLILGLAGQERPEM